LLQQAHGQSLVHTQTGVGGTIGVGVVSSVGAGETGIKAKDIVLVVGQSWADNVTVSVNNVVKLPSTISVEEAATIPVLTAALGIINKLPTLHADDILFQTQGSTAIGQAIHQIGKAEGVKVVSVNDADLLDAKKLATLGKATHGIIGISNGKVIHQLTKTLKDNGSIVVHQGAHQMISATTSIDLAVGGAIFHNLSVHGFNLVSWAKQEPVAFRNAVATAYKLVLDKKVSIPCSVFPLSDFKKAFGIVETTGALSAFKF
jgi:NADPH:quinone reductase-like Zn-dependent oxidoreductase